jgi:hypothetical protein
MKVPILQQKGSAIIEFALSFILIWVLILGVIEFSRLMFSWSTAGEASRLAARLASICSNDSAQQDTIKKRVSWYIEASGQIDLGNRADWLDIKYLPSGCNSNSCTMVETTLVDLKPILMVPGLNSIVTLPNFRTALPREVMLTNFGEVNHACD